MRLTPRALVPADEGLQGQPVIHESLRSERQLVTADKGIYGRHNAFRAKNLTIRFYAISANLILLLYIVIHCF